jgi:light-regulated signal transduction histidine kinase (bacteriophytochrome)
MNSVAGLPLMVKDLLLGVLYLHSRRPNAFHDLLPLLTAFANQVAIAIENARLHEQARQEIAERQRAEAELQTYAARLERSNRELESFAYIASHDLKEPLRKIQAFGDRLQAKYGEVLNEQGRDYLMRMQNAATRMQALIDGLLIYSRVTTKAQPFVTVDLNAVVREVLADLEVRIEQLAARVEVGDLPTIEADPLQMRQLFQNLIGNALKFHRQDVVPLVRVQGELLDGGAGQYRITVEDNGIGFDEKYLDRLFQVFQRLHGRSEYEGAGIGLAICRKIIERHGGSITARGVPDQGATFIITLPARQPAKESA